MADQKEVKRSDLDASREKYDSSSAESTVADEFADINEKALLRRLDYKLLPPLTILYLLSFLDRSNGTRLRALDLATFMLIFTFLSGQCAFGRLD
jgi:hypothetical protein